MLQTSIIQIQVLSHQEHLQDCPLYYEYSQGKSTLILYSSAYEKYEYGYLDH